MLKSIACGLALAASLPAAAAAPDTNVERRQTTVHYDDLNLASPNGIAALERRLVGAARDVCGYAEARHYTRIVPSSVSACVTAALASAREQVALKEGVAVLKG